MLKQKIHDTVSLAVIGLASVAAATATMAAASETGAMATASINHSTSMMSMHRETTHISRRTLIQMTKEPTNATPLVSTDCKLAPPTVCQKTAVCVKSNGTNGGVARWICPAPNRK